MAPALLHSEQVSGNVIFTVGATSAAESWSGLTAGQRYMGAVQYLMGTTPLSTTLLEVDATNRVPAAGVATKVAAGATRTAAQAD